MARLTYKEVIKELPELKDFELDGSTDFTRIARVVGSRNPKVVWAIINALEKPEEAPAKPGLTRLMAKLEK